MSERDLKLAEMLWEYCRESKPLRQAVLAVREPVLIEAKARTEKGRKVYSQVPPSPIRGVFANGIAALAGCPSWPEESAQASPDEIATVARLFAAMPSCRAVQPKASAGFTAPNGKPVVRLDWQMTRFAPDADALPLALVEIDWRLSKADIAKQIQDMRPARFKEYARARKGTPEVFGEQLPFTPDAACRALEVLRQFKRCGNRWPDYFKKHPPKMELDIADAEREGKRSCAIAKKMLAFLESESLPG